MGGKTLVCRCEDVTLLDLEKAFQAGFHDMESLKRYTGFSTGFCQGKSCTAHAARFLADKLGSDADAHVNQPPRTRPLLHPTPANMFAGAGDPELIGPSDQQPEQTASDRIEEHK